MHGKAVKLCITAPPVDGKANSAVLVFLAKLFELPKSSLHIKTGRQARSKQIIITDISLARAKDILSQKLQKTP
jgi:uncharacterized protein (TIGR00251 family)